MPPIELDKPSTAPIDAGRSEDQLHVLDVERDGRHGTVVRDDQGNLAYPNYVPPDVELPISRPRATSEGVPGRTRTPDPAEGPKKSKSEPLNKPRPELAGSSSYAPRRTQRRPSTFPAFPLMKRAGTNVSMLDTAIRNAYKHERDDDSSSSSSSEAEDSERHTDRHNDHPTERRERKSFEDRYRRFRVANDFYHTKGKVSKRDGRLNITVNDTSNTGYLAKALGTAVKKVVTRKGDESKTDQRSASSRLSSATTATSEKATRPKLNIVIMVIGSRGDAQPFLKIGKVLKEEYGHRVRIATHPAFRDFIEKDSGLEFFSVGGDPSELMAFMVKNPGMIPTLETVKAGDIGRRRAAMAEMFEGFWRACINATDNEKDVHNVKMMGEKDPFVADAIIANPPSFAHIHCAEALGIPVHLMFTFPYTPTQAFPHPLASIKKSNVDPGYTNFISYPLVEMMVWQGLGDLVNNFRVKTLGLDPVSTLWAPGATYRLHVPFTYLWSPSLVPKPDDWGDEIDISGFVFLDLASTFEPPESLVKFLDDGEMPIYIGFGSIVVDDADHFTEMVFEAVRLAGVRALVSKGWGGLGQDNVPENIYMLDNTPHDWLFPRVRACVIHGGAGTTAIALKCGKPTMIVPFFGDQHFWGSMVGNAGAGPMPVPYKKLTAESLAEGIKYCMTDEALEAAQKIARDIELEGDGAKNAVRAFHRNLALSGEHSMRCSILDDRVAVWRVRQTSLKLSALAADIAVSWGLISWRRLRLLRHKEWNDFEGPGEPITGIFGSLIGTVGDVFGGIGSVPYRLAKTSNKRAERKKRREKRRQQKREEIARRLTGYPFPKQGDGTAGVVAQETNYENAPIQDTAITPGSALQPAQEEYLHELEEGVGQTGRALAHAPVDLALALAQGFHNAPRLYGDETVRRPIRVTGIRSGLKAAGYEFVYGFYDGFTGLVRLPVRGAREDGFKGALAGIGMGLTGFVLKDIAALVGPIGYTLKGIAKQVDRGKQPLKYLRRARIIQAQREFNALSEAERRAVIEAVLKGWQVIQKLANIIMQEKEKRQFMLLFSRRIGRRSKRARSLGKYGKGPAFESVTAAETAIEAITRGEEVDLVLRKHEKSFFDVPGQKDKVVNPGIVTNSTEEEQTNENIHQPENEVSEPGEGRKQSMSAKGKDALPLPSTEPTTSD
ncbi:glycosyltransferase family 1 protein [Hypoxylon sp. FL0890]|nr:glycosyltransferase family 1 protein [Hypoxylon sp. FL0890]